MTIVIRTPADEPYGCFHPESPFHGFYRDGVYWPTVAVYCLAQELIEPDDRERIRCRVRDLAEARAVAATLARHEDAAARALAALPVAVRRSCEHNLWMRALLVDTGDTPIEAHLDGDAVLGVGPDGRGRNELGRALEAVRAELRERALDPAAVQCEHHAAVDVTTDATGRVCTHVLADRASMRRYHRWFTGDGATYVLVCPACRDALPAPPPLRTLCRDCFERYLGGDRQPDAGRPAFARPATSRRFERRSLACTLAPADVAAIAPVPRVAGGWLVLDRGGRFHRLDIGEDVVRAAGAIDGTELDLAGPMVLVVAPGGALVAVAEAKARRAIVVDVTTGAITVRKQRDDYHPEHCRFPLAWTEHDGCPTLIHATDWNRLDLCDPITGACLSERGPTGYARGEERPPHYLDYFHAGLVASPDGRFVVDNGWVWHPFAVPRVFDAHRWLAGNPWESEDGPSVHELGGVNGYAWDGPVAWLDERRVALWGEGDDDLALTPAARVYDAATGAELVRFPGPRQGLAATGGLLLSFEPDAGTDVWDPVTGAQVHEDPTLATIAAHPTSGEVLAWDGDRLVAAHLR